MKNVFNALRLVVLLTGCIGSTVIACRKNDAPSASQQQQPFTPAVRPIGSSIGTAVKKQIGAQGGEIKSSDNAISVVIPPGALTTTTEISIEPITNTNIAGVQHAWRLAPHGQQFAKPVIITTTYNLATDTISLEESLGLSYQDQKGIWKYIGRTAIDKVNKKVSAQTTHFSDWVLMPTAKLDPGYKELYETQSLTLKVVEYIDNKDGDLIVPIPGSSGEHEVGYSQLDSRWVTKWNLGGAGTLSPNGSAAEYKAPATITTSQIVAVSAELKASSLQQNQLTVVANIKLIGKELEIEYLQVDEDSGHLYIYGHGFGHPTEAKPVVKINNSTVDASDILFWGDPLIKLKLPYVGPNSSGEIRVTAKGKTSAPHILNEWNGQFNYFRPQGRVGQGIHEKITFYVRLRGDASPMPPAIIPIVMHNTVNKLSHATWEAGGIGSSTAECNFYHVTWSDVNGDIPLSPLKADSYGERAFKVNLDPKDRLFEMIMHFEAREAIPSVLKITFCNGSPPVNENRKEWITFFEFEFEKIKLKLNGTTIKAGEVIKTTVPSSGLNWMAGEYPSFTHQVKVQWDDIPSRY
jgi:hypothetical protein